MEVIRGRERDCRQEIRRAAKRGRAREALGVYPLGQTLDAAVDEGAHPFEGGCEQNRECIGAIRESALLARENLRSAADRKLSEGIDRQTGSSGLGRGAVGLVDARPALQEAAVDGSIDPHFETGARQKKARPDGGRSGTVNPRALAVVRKCREDGLRGPKPPLSMDAARLGEREGGRHCRHRRPDFCAHCRLSMATTKPNKVVERTCISHIARDRVATNKSR
jgi:hypothetical protein